MNIVRRQQREVIEFEGQEVRALPQQTEGLSIVRGLVLQPQPMVGVQWQSTRWHDGVRLLGFRSETGFCPVQNPDDLNQHGQLIIESRQDDEHIDFLSDGTYYYTFMLHKPGLFGLWNLRSQPLRFNVSVPSVRAQIQRQKDQAELQSLPAEMLLANLERRLREIGVLTRLVDSEQKLKCLLNPPSAAAKPSKGSPLDREVDALNDVIKAAYTQQEMRKNIEKNREFKKLNPTTKEWIRQMIEQRLDPSEFGSFDKEDE